MRELCFYLTAQEREQLVDVGRAPAAARASSATACRPTRRPSPTRGPPKFCSPPGCIRGNARSRSSRWRRRCSTRASTPGSPWSAPTKGEGAAVAGSARGPVPASPGRGAWRPTRSRADGRRQRLCAAIGPRAVSYVGARSDVGRFARSRLRRLRTAPVRRAVEVAESSPSRRSRRSRPPSRPSWPTLRPQPPRVRAAGRPYRLGTT